jgi:hypothetical protein
VSGAIRLGSVKHSIISLSCAQCGRHGKYKVDNLLKAYGPDIGLPDLKWKLTKCDRNDLGRLHEYCRAAYDLDYGAV